MRWTCFFLTGLALVPSACAALSPSKATRWPPAVQEGHIDIASGIAAQVNTLQLALKDEFHRQDCAALASHFAQRGEEVETWCRDTAPKARSPLEPQFDAFYPLGGGVVGSLTLYVPSGDASIALDTVWFGPTGDVWRVFKEGSWPVDRGQLVAERARVSLSTESEWMAADVEVDVDTQGAGVLAFALGARSTGGKGGLRLVSVQEEGRPCAFRVTPDGVAVALHDACPVAHLSMRYEGEAPQNEGDYIKATDVVLRAESGWLPLLGDGLADFDVTVFHPSALQVFGQGLALPAQRLGDGWSESHWKFRGDSFTLYGGSHYKLEQFDVNGLHVTVAVWPEHAAWAPVVRDALSKALTAYSPLGPYPYPTLNVVETGFMGGYGGVSNITLSERSLRGEPIPDDHFQPWVSHEVAHGWFPGIVPCAGTGPGMWPESFAEFLSSWALSEDAAAAKRSQWRKDFEALPAEQQKIPIAEAGWHLGWPAHKALTYSKASLILLALEHRLGHEAMVKVLQAFIRERKDKPSTWASFVDIVRTSCGEAEATRLEQDLKSPSLPEDVAAPN
jgi:hypothetical protein